MRHDRGRSACGIIAALVLGLSASACTTNGQPTLATATPRGPTVAFESIDGPPESVFQRLVQTLSDEAEARQLAVVSREGPAKYRVRGYVAALTQGKRSTIAWVWDVYDTEEQRRAVRISGEEPASPAGQGTWAIADDSALRRIAHVGMDRLVAFLASPAPPVEEAPAPADQKPATTIATAEEPAALAMAAVDTANVPLPKRRPASASLVSQESLAYLPPGW